MHLPPISVAQMREVDRLTSKQYGIALLQMMENAGRSLAALARHRLGGSAAGAHVVVLVGPGNNGGGGLAAARHLANAGADVFVALSQPPPLPGEVPERQRRALERMGVAGSDRAVVEAALSAHLAAADLILDALIGYSLRGAPREPIATLIRAANDGRAPALALDLPSGLDGNGGDMREPTIRAEATLTLAWPKTGLLARSAAPCVGTLWLADISVPAAAYRAVGVEPENLFAAGPIVAVQVLDGEWEPGTGVNGS
jgi:NAD(P)H-hydrate epimerase